MRKIVVFGYIETQPWTYVSTFFDGLLSRDLGMAVNVYSWKKKTVTETKT